MPKHILNSHELRFKFTWGLKKLIKYILDHWCAQLKRVDAVCQQLLTKAMANENHTWNLTLKIKILKKMWYTSRKFCTLTLLSFLNSSQTTKSPNLFWGLESRIEVWKLQTNYVTEHFFCKNQRTLIILNTFSLFRKGLTWKVHIFLNHIFSPALKKPKVASERLNQSVC